MQTKIIYNTDWAKENISMPELLRCFGHEPVQIKRSGTEYWYISPFRYEKEPSFHTSYLNGKWIWNDFGRGDVKGNGTVIGFMQMHENVGVKTTLQLLKGMFPNRGRAVSLEALKLLPLFKKVELVSPKPKPNEILAITEIKEQIWDKTLIGYLAGERKINHKLARKYLRKIIYENTQTGKSYNTLGFMNQSGDYECRDKYFKGILKAPSSDHQNAAKDISFIPGNDHSRIAIFEGFMDFLTVLTNKNMEVLPLDVLVLNMVNLRKRGLDFIKSGDYKEVFTFFDNDAAGEKTTDFFKQELGRKVNPQNHLYKNFKDYNQFWQKRNGKE